MQTESNRNHQSASDDTNKGIAHAQNAANVAGKLAKYGNSAKAAAATAKAGKGAAAGIKAAKAAAGGIGLAKGIIIVLIIIAIIILIPLIMLPILIFGGLSGGDNSDAPNPFDMAAIVRNIEEAENIVAEHLTAQYSRTLSTINSAVATARASYGNNYFEYEIDGIDFDQFSFNIAFIISMYSASKMAMTEEISLENLRVVLEEAEGIRNFFSFEKAIETEARFRDPPPVWDDVSERYIYPARVHYTVTIYAFEINFEGEELFAELFGIAENEEKMALAREYARNLMSITGGGILLAPGIVDGFYSPFPGTQWQISSCFGPRVIFGRHEHHCGTDIPKPAGTPMRAIADGVVVRVSSSAGGYGNLVVIYHGNAIYSYYGHNRVNLVTNRQVVRAGEIIAEVGSTGRSTGPHLHLGIRVNGARVPAITFIGPPPGGCRHGNCG